MHVFFPLNLYFSKQHNSAHWCYCIAMDHIQGFKMFNTLIINMQTTLMGMISVDTKSQRVTQKTKPGTEQKKNAPDWQSPVSCLLLIEKNKHVHTFRHQSGQQPGQVINLHVQVVVGTSCLLLSLKEAFGDLAYIAQLSVSTGVQHLQSIHIETCIKQINLHEMWV